MLKYKIYWTQGNADTATTAGNLTGVQQLLCRN